MRQHPKYHPATVLLVAVPAIATALIVVITRWPMVHRFTDHAALVIMLVGVTLPLVNFISEKMQPVMATFMAYIAWGSLLSVATFVH